MTVGTYLPRPAGAERMELEHRLTNPDLPSLVGAGPAEFATTMAVESHPAFIWDTNCYYADLGVSVRATRKQIKERYQELDGPNDTRLTMIAEVLLNPTRRHTYDLTPFGSFFYDAYIEEGIRRRLTEEVTKRLQDGEDLDDILDEKGDRFEDAIDEMEILSLQSQLAVQRALGRHKWSYYLWKSTCTNTGVLDEWRRLLVFWLWYYRADVGPISVGFMSGGETVAVRKVGQRVVVFIDDQVTPDDVLACIAVAELRSN